jgi:hypothetical protein
VPKEIDPTRSPATQPYRTTKAAQLAARRLRITTNGRTATIVTLRPLADVLSPTTRAMLAAIAEKGGRS